MAITEERRSRKRSVEGRINIISRSTKKMTRKPTRSVMTQRTTDSTTSKKRMKKMTRRSTSAKEGRKTHSLENRIRGEKENEEIGRPRREN